MTVALGGPLAFRWRCENRGPWCGGCGGTWGSRSSTLQSSVLTLKVLNLLQHGLIRSNRAFLNNDLSQLPFDGVVAVVPQVWVLPWKHVLSHVGQGRIEVGTCTLNVPAVMASCLDLNGSRTVCLPLANERRPQLFKPLVMT